LGTGTPNAAFLTAKKAKYRKDPHSEIQAARFCVISRLLRLTGWEDLNSWNWFRLGRKAKYAAIILRGRRRVAAKRRKRRKKRSSLGSMLVFATSALFCG
jgi:hypothetical protein